MRRSMKELDIFIEGECVDLCIPTEQFALNGDWYKWFNKKTVTRYLEQGVYPNDCESQRNFFLDSISSNRLTLIISNKKKYLGVVSLSSINLNKKNCEIAIVIDNESDIINSPYIALEAISLLTTHAFEMLGIIKIKAGQHIDLSNWQQIMELAGYRLEGMHTNGFIKGREVATSVTIGCSLEDYDLIVSSRGALWDSRKKMMSRIVKLPKRSFNSEYQRFIKSSDDYYRTLFIN